MISKNAYLIVMSLCILAALLVAGCTQQATPVQPQTTGPTVLVTASPTSAGMPNPASVHCISIGGNLEIRKDAAGNEYGMCNFPNGTSCEEWALFRNEGCKPFTPMTTTGTAVGIANPASEHCGTVGAVNEILKNPDGSEYGVCKFPNGTSCEEWALYRGEGCKP